MKGLPATSLTQTVLRDTLEMDEADEDTPPQFGPWSQENYQLATLIDVVQNLTKVLIDVNSEKASDPVQPMPRPMPKIRPNPAKLAAQERIWDELEAIRERHRRETGR